MTINKYLRVGLICLIFSNGAESVNLNELIDMAVENNPEILSAKARYDSAIRKTPLLRNLKDPWFSMEFSKDMWMYAVAQEFPFPTKMFSRSKLAQFEAKRFYEELRAKIREIIKRTRDAYGQLAIIQKEEEILSKTRSLLEELLTITQRKYELNRVPLSDVLHTRIALEKLKNDLADIANKRLIINAELNQLLNLPADTVLPLNMEIEIEPLRLSPDTLYHLAAENNPLLKSMQAQILSAKTSLSIARQEYLPDFMVKFEQTKMESEFQNPKFMIGFTIPLWFWARQKNMVDEMKSEVKMVEADYRAMENEILKMVRKTVLLLKNQQRKIKLYENSIIPQLNAALSSAQRAYEAGNADLMTVLETLSMLNENTIEYYRAQVDYFIGLAQLEEIVGISFSQGNEK